jgi:hypothetical protein
VRERELRQQGGVGGGRLHLAGENRDLVAQATENGDPLLRLEGDAVDAADAADDNPDSHGARQAVRGLN